MKPEDHFSCGYACCLSTYLFLNKSRNDISDELFEECFADYTRFLKLKNIIDEYDFNVISHYYKNYKKKKKKIKKQVTTVTVLIEDNLIGVGELY